MPIPNKAIMPGSGTPCGGGGGGGGALPTLAYKLKCERSGKLLQFPFTQKEIVKVPEPLDGLTSKVRSSKRYVAKAV
jgi:hypothetical protein